MAPPGGRRPDGRAVPSVRGVRFSRAVLRELPIPAPASGGVVRSATSIALVLLLATIVVASAVQLSRSAGL